MAFQITCPACGKAFQLATEIYEKKVSGKVVSIKCKQCQRGIRVDATVPGQLKVAGSSDASSGQAAAEPTVSSPVRARQPTLIGGMSSTGEVFTQGAGGGLWAVDSGGSGDDRELTEEEIAQEIAAGTIRAETLVWREGLSDWAEVQSVPTFAALFAGAPAIDPAADEARSAPAPVPPPPAPVAKPAPFARRPEAAPAAPPMPVAATPAAAPVAEKAPSDPRGLPAPRAKMPSATGGLPAPRAKMPSATGELPAPRAKMPSATGGLPAPRAKMPSTTGELPAPRAKMPSATGGLPAPRAKMPSTTGELPAPRAKMPSAAGLPPPRARLGSSPGLPPERPRQPSAPNLPPLAVERAGMDEEEATVIYDRSAPDAAAMFPFAAPQPEEPAAPPPPMGALAEEAEPVTEQLRLATFARPESDAVAKQPAVPPPMPGLPRQEEIVTEQLVVPALMPPLPPPLPRPSEPATAAGSTPYAARLPPIVMPPAPTPQPAPAALMQAAVAPAPAAPLQGAPSPMGQPPPAPVPAAAIPWAPVQPPVVSAPGLGSTTGNPFNVVATTDLAFPAERSKRPMLIAAAIAVVAVIAGIAIAVSNSGDAPPVPNALPAPPPPAANAAPTVAQTNEGTTPGPTKTSGGELPTTTQAPSGNFSDLFAAGVEKARSGSGKAAQRFNPDQAKRAVAETLESVAGCKEAGGATGQAAAAVTFSSDGRVSAVTIGAPFAGTSTGTCIVAALKRAKMEPFAGLPGTISQAVSLR